MTSSASITFFVAKNLQNPESEHTGKSFTMDIDNDQTTTMIDLNNYLISQLGNLNFIVHMGGQNFLSLCSHFLNLYGLKPVGEYLKYPSSSKFVITARIFSTELSVVVRSGCQSEVVVIEIHEADTIGLLKELIAEKIEILPNEQVLSIANGQENGKELRDEATLSEANFKNMMTVNVSRRVKGGARPGGAGQKFGMVDVFNHDAVRDIHFTPSPPWRIVHKGLNIEGICSTLHCEAEGKKVLCKIGFGTFSFRETSKESLCPMCSKETKAVNLCFSNCFYTVRGVSAVGNDEKLLKWTKVGNYGRTWDPVQAGTKEWAFVEITTRSLELGCAVPSNPEVQEAPVCPTCSICFSSLNPSQNVRMLSCCHSYHNSCFKSWSQSLADDSGDGNCPECLHFSM